MRKSLVYTQVFLLLIIIPWVCFSCNSKGATENNDRSRAIDLISQSYDEIYTDPAKVEKNFVKLQKQITDSTAYYLLDVYIGLARMTQDDLATCSKKYDAAMNYCKRNPDDHMLFGTLWNLKALKENYEGNREKALVYYNKAYDEFIQTKDWAKLIDVCINIADSYVQLADPAKATSMYRRGLFISDSTNVHICDYSLLSGLANTYSKMGNYSMGNKYFEKALKYENTEGVYEKMFFYCSRGTSEYYQKQYSKAINSFYKARKYANELHQADLIGIAEGNLGEVYMLIGNLDSAEIFIHKARQRFNSVAIPSEEQIFYVNSLLADLYVRKGDMAKAKEYVDINPDTVNTMPRYLSLHFNRVQNYLYKLQDYKGAYHALKRADHYDSIVQGSMEKDQIMEMEYRYKQDTLVLHNNLRIAKKDKEVQHLSMILYALGIFLLLVIVSSFVYYRFRIKKRELAESKLRANLMMLRMETVRNRISPHFIFNVLNRELDMTSPGVTNLVNLLRKSLEISEKYIVSLQTELNFIETYIAIEKASLGDNFTYTCEIDDAIDTSAVMIPSMMLHIFVENALKHSLRGFDGVKYINISIRMDGNNRVYTITNNGNVRNTNATKSSTGLGLRIVTQTIQILNGRNKNKISLHYGIEKDASGNNIWKVVLIAPKDFDYTIK